MTIEMPETTTYRCQVDIGRSCDWPWAESASQSENQLQMLDVKVPIIVQVHQNCPLEKVTAVLLFRSGDYVPVLDSSTLKSSSQLHPDEPGAAIIVIHRPRL